MLTQRQWSQNSHDSLGGVLIYAVLFSMLGGEKWEGEVKGRRKYEPLNHHALSILVATDTPRRAALRATRRCTIRIRDGRRRLVAATRIVAAVLARITMMARPTLELCSGILGAARLDDFPQLARGIA